MEIVKFDANIIEQIHSDIIILDAHLDLPYSLYEDHKLGRFGTLKEKHLEKFRAGVVNVLICAIYVDTNLLPEGAQREALGQIAAFYREVEACPDCRVCLSYQEIEEAISDGKIAMILSFEGVEPLGSNPELLYLYYKLGVRGLGVTWARRNLAADGAPFDDEEGGQNNGLSSFGYQIVKLADSLGMFLDISHLNDVGAKQVIDLVKKPVIASHSNCRAIRRTPRNLGDEVVAALAAKGGVMGMNACSALVAATPEQTDINSFADHFVHAKEVAGVDFVGLGFDFCDGFTFQVPEIVIDGTAHNIFNVVKGYPGIRDLTAALLRKGFAPQEIKKIYGGNFMRVLKEVL